MLSKGALVVFSLSMVRFNPHSFIPSGKQGIASALNLGSPCFSGGSFYWNLARIPLNIVAAISPGIPKRNPL